MRRGSPVTIVATIGVLAAATFLLIHLSDASHPQHAEILTLDPKTGETVDARSADGGYAVAALLRDGSIAVASEDSCPDGEGGEITVLDAALVRVISTRDADPCAVARLDPEGLRARVQKGAASGSSSPGIRRKGNVVTAYDGAGNVRWRRTFTTPPLGSVDARGGRIVVTELGSFTRGTG